ncbi:MAG: YdcH family protein [Acidobacteria bacterium]|nr:YdcH family protein [Acidobacteriota bacterium]
MNATCRTHVLLGENKEFRQLNREHQELETRLRSLCRRRFLKAGEELETRRLKKRKLFLKDRMAAIVQEDSNSGNRPA